ncbi:PREDICTED: T-cell surface antigen CD2-like, partial [Acanthisitta chloris]|uniref:T-cell surface antigen CD2-like n=1 Tax=Acanthisitta chloris TaxID=57068 RepID=UPI0004F0F55A
MNFRRIFLVKCFLLLFPSVKCSSTKLIYKAVNETVLLSIAAAQSMHEVAWKRDGQSLIQMKDNILKYYVNKNVCRCKILPNGTLQIQQVEKKDSGNYTGTAYRKDGKWIAEEHIMFFVQEPVPQPILSAECVNKTVFVKCEVKQKAKDELFIMELTQFKGRKIQKNVTILELNTRHPGTFRCVVKNQASEKMTEKVFTCS